MFLILIKWVNSKAFKRRAKIQIQKTRVKKENSFNVIQNLLKSSKKTPINFKRIFNFFKVSLTCHYL